MKILKSNLKQELLTRVESIDDKFIGYTGDKYIYILDILVSQTSGDIILKFWILNEVDEDGFIRVPNGNDFIFETQQKDGLPFTNINGEPVLIYDSEGNVVTDETVNRLRVNEFTRNIEAFAPILAPAMFVTIKRYLGEQI